ncbi:hypothetical protein CLOM_g19981, partial [Closterium sp. NIES-68]
LLPGPRLLRLRRLAPAFTRGSRRWVWCGCPQPASSTRCAWWLARATSRRGGPVASWRCCRWMVLTWRPHASWTRWWRRRGASW